MVRKDETIELDMSVDEALKYVVSMGVVVPSARARLPNGSDAASADVPVAAPSSSNPT